MTTESTALAVPPTLEDPDTLAELLTYAGGEFLRALRMEDPEEAARKVSEVLFGLAGVFSEESGIVQLPKGWTLAGAGARLRNDEIVVARLKELSDEDRALFDEDDQIIVLAIQVFFEEIEELARDWFERNNAEAFDDEAIHRFLADPVVHLMVLEFGSWLLGESTDEKTAKDAEAAE